ncbi:MAG TPA: MarR family transcriptional regulator [Kofleriaceae bacterium]|nr:MarR family transcriptional regulator [Kofleriaceae bacterium]
MFDGCLYFNTTALARLLEREWTAAFAPFELTPPQAFMLRLVLDRPGLSQRELADAMTIARPTATRVLDGLEARRLIARRAGQADGREQHIHPTATAEAIRGPLNAASGSVTRRLKQLLGPHVFDQTVGKIRDVRSALAGRSDRDD